MAKKNKIKIKESKKGTFTKAANERGLGVQEFAKKVLSNKDQYSSTMVKKANFARNASKWDKEFGGVLETISGVLPALDALVPGVGTGASALTGIMANMLEDKPNPVADPVQNTNPYAMRGGGDVKGFKQYNAPSHEAGGQVINESGNVTTSNPTAEIEGTENAYTYSKLPDSVGKTYVFSDANGTSGLVQGIIKKYYGKADTDNLAKNAMEAEMKQVENLNEKINNVTNVVTDLINQRYGGKLNKMQLGGDSTDPYTQRLAAQQRGYDASLGLHGTDPLDTINTPGFVASTTPQDMTGGSSILNTTPTPTEPRANTLMNDDQFGIDMSQEAASMVPFAGAAAGVPAAGDPKTNPFADTVKNVLGEINFSDVLRTTGLVGSAIDAFGKPDVEKPILPDYSRSDARFNAMNADLTQARQDALAATNVAQSAARNTSGSFSQMRSRQLQNVGNLQDVLGRIGAQERGMRNQILGQQGQYEVGKATTNAQILDDVQQRNLANKARTQDLRKQFFSDIVHEADRLDTNKNMREIADAQIAEGTRILQMIAPDFDINASMVKDIIEVSRGLKSPEELTEEELIVYKRLNP